MNIIEKIKKIDDLDIISNNGASEEQILRAEEEIQQHKQNIKSRKKIRIKISRRI